MADQISLKKGLYKHFKGNLYRVMEVARHSETQEVFVVYQALYGEHGIWVRPLAMFDETIERGGRLQKRFQYIGETVGDDGTEHVENEAERPSKEQAVE